MFRLSAAAPRAASSTPIGPTKKQAEREKAKNAAEPSAVFFGLCGRDWWPRTPKMVAAESPAARSSIAAAISSPLLKRATMSNAPTTNQNAP